MTRCTISGPEGSRREEGYAELHVNADGFRCAGEMAYSVGFFEEFFTAALPGQAPATVTLSPSAATNPVDTFHELTATVRDDGGEPVAGAIVRFAVTGASSASGDCTSDGNGECRFSYQVASFPGEDTIEAYVDVDADGVRDDGEPMTTASKTIVFPASTPGHTTGGGQFHAADGRSVTLRVAVRSDGSNLQGDCTIVDKAAGATIKCLDVLAYVQHGSNTIIFGHVEQNDTPTLSRIALSDNGEDGAAAADEITVTTMARYSASGSVTSGDIQIR